MKRPELGLRVARDVVARRDGDVAVIKQFIKVNDVTCGVQET